MRVTDGRWYSEIADALRTAYGDSRQYRPSEMAGAIRGLLERPVPYTQRADYCAIGPSVYRSIAAMPTSEYLNITGNIATEVRSSAFYSREYGISSPDRVYPDYVYYPNVSVVRWAAFNQCYQVSYVELPRCVEIDADAFHVCNILSLSLPECVTIGDNAFLGCSVSRLDLPKCRTIGYGAFANMLSATSISLPECEYISDRAFNNCRSLSEVYLPKCEFIGSAAFGSCSTLKSVDAPVCTFVSAEAFAICHSLASVSLPECREIGFAAFSACPGLTYVNLPKCSSVGGYAFFACLNLVDVQTMSVSVIDYATFAACYALPKVPDSFSNCVIVSDYGLQECTFSSLYLPECELVSYCALRGCSNLTTVSLPKCNHVGFAAFYQCSNLTTMSIPTCTYIDSRAFWDCKNLTSLYLDSVSQVTSFFSRSGSSYDAFYSASIPTVYVPASLYGDFVADSMWASMASKIVSV